MRVHLTGEEEGQTRVIECKRVPKACRDFYRAERDNATTAIKAKQSKQISAIKEAMHSASEASDSRKRKAATQEGSISTRILTVPENLRNVQSLTMDRMIVSSYFCF